MRAGLQRRSFLSLILVCVIVYFCDVELLGNLRLAKLRSSYFNDEREGFNSDRGSKLISRRFIPGREAEKLEVLGQNKSNLPKGFIETRIRRLSNQERGNEEPLGKVEEFQTFAGKEVLSGKRETKNVLAGIDTIVLPRENDHPPTNLQKINSEGTDKSVLDDIDVVVLPEESRSFPMGLGFRAKKRRALDGSKDSSGLASIDQMQVQIRDDEDKSNYVVPMGLRRKRRSIDALEANQGNLDLNDDNDENSMGLKDLELSHTNKNRKQFGIDIDEIVSRPPRIFGNLDDYTEEIRTREREISNETNAGLRQDLRQDNAPLETSSLLHLKELSKDATVTSPYRNFDNEQEKVDSVQATTASKSDETDNILLRTPFLGERRRSTSTKQVKREEKRGEDQDTNVNNQLRPGLLERNDISIGFYPPIFPRKLKALNSSNKPSYLSELDDADEKGSDVGPLKERKKVSEDEKRKIEHDVEIVKTRGVPALQGNVDVLTGLLKVRHSNLSEKSKGNDVNAERLAATALLLAEGFSSEKFSKVAEEIKELEEKQERISSGLKEKRRKVLSELRKAKDLIKNRVRELVPDAKEAEKKVKLVDEVNTIEGAKYLLDEFDVDAVPLKKAIQELDTAESNLEKIAKEISSRKAYKDAVAKDDLRYVEKLIDKVAEDSKLLGGSKRNAKRIVRSFLSSSTDENGVEPVAVRLQSSYSQKARKSSEEERLIKHVSSASVDEALTDKKFLTQLQEMIEGKRNYR